ncbi:MAG: hypothetical protein FWE86_01270 [Oscillospiraceae bacterium]|nr:hypothetical protein [Oscillospiraceae bacterium]
MNLFEHEMEKTVDNKIAWDAYIKKAADKAAALWEELGKSGSGRRYLISGVVYSLLVAVVIYGNFCDRFVYEGFPKIIPWVIMAVFAAMAVLRFKMFRDTWKNR